MLPSISSIPGVIENREGLPRIDWGKLVALVDWELDASDLHSIWTKFACEWLQLLESALPADMQIYESKEFMLLASCDVKTATRLLKSCEHARHMILSTLAGVASDEGYGKYVVLGFEAIDSYYDYIVDFYPDEGEFGLSSGMFINEGYAHFAICLANYNECERIIAHELNHNLLRHLPLPLWVNEGVTQNMEDIIVGDSGYFIDSEGRRKHREYWTSDSIQQFWVGDSFFAADEGQDLSYELSRIMFRHLMSDYPKKVLQFLSSADHEDAGNAALMEACGITLSDCVAGFLGKGNWAYRKKREKPDP